jgi:hypothetical protein
VTPLVHSQEGGAASTDSVVWARPRPLSPPLQHIREHGEHALLVHPVAQYGLAASFLLLGLALSLAGLLGWMTFGEFLLEG